MGDKGVYNWGDLDFLKHAMCSSLRKTQSHILDKVTHKDVSTKIRSMTTSYAYCIKDFPDLQSTRARKKYIHNS